MELGLPTPVSHPPFREQAFTAALCIHPQMYICKDKKLANFGKLIFYIKKSEKVFGKLN
jgi:hypothetical protein